MNTHPRSYKAVLKNKLGDCRNENLVEELFGSVTDFAQLIDEYGDNFTHGNIKVEYNPETDIDTFYEL